MTDAYAIKLDKDFARCKTAKHVQEKIAYYEKWNDYLDLGLSGSAAAVGFGTLLAELGFGMGIPYADKFGHAAKGLVANRITGKFFDSLYRWWNKDKIKDADDDVRANLKPFVPRVTIEGASTAISAYGWEVLQRDVPAFPGSHFDLNDMMADTAGHVFGSVVEYKLAWRRKHQYDAASKRLEELGKKPLPPIWKFGFGGASPRHNP